MAAPRPKKRALSDRLKNMRFMKRGEENSLREKLIEDQKKRAKDAHWSIQVDAHEGKATPVVVIEDGMSGDPLCARHGRQSFGKFNSVFEYNAPPTLSNLSNVEKTTINRTNRHHQPENDKPCKEEPSLAAGFSRTDHSDTEKDPASDGNSRLQGPRRTIMKKKKRRIGRMKL